MRTIVLSDMHLGTSTGRDLLSGRAARAALSERLDGADRVVLLGDVLELRERPVAAVLAHSEPFFRELGEVLGGRARITLVAGNHDHQLAAPVLQARELDGERGSLELARSAPVPETGALAVIADWLAGAELELSYPGVWLRPDVFAIHGHYLDCHAAIPALERLAVAATERITGGPPPGPRTVDDYEAATEPLYSLLYSLAQASRRRRVALVRPGRSAAAWAQLSGSNGRRTARARLTATLLVPLAVAALNRMGVGPLTADLSGPSLRRSSLRGIAAVVADLGVDAAHVVFGHTHRPGPLPHDAAAEWKLPGGGTLVNTGSWVHEPSFLGASPLESPYWPGTCVVIDEGGPPRVERVLDDLA